MPTGCTNRGRRRTRPSKDPNFRRLTHGESNPRRQESPPSPLAPPPVLLSPVFLARSVPQIADARVPLPPPTTAAVPAVLFASSASLRPRRGHRQGPAGVRLFLAGARRTGRKPATPRRTRVQPGRLGSGVPPTTLTGIRAPGGLRLPPQRLPPRNSSLQLGFSVRQTAEASTHRWPRQKVASTEHCSQVSTLLLALQNL